MVPGHVRRDRLAGAFGLLIALACSDGASPSGPDPDNRLAPGVRDLLTAHLADPLLLFYLPDRLSDHDGASSLRDALGRLSSAVLAEDADEVRRSLAQAAAAVGSYRERAAVSEGDATSLAAIDLYLAQGTAILEGRLTAVPNLNAEIVRERGG